MFIRRRRLLWLILVIGSSWVVISTYIVRGKDDSNTSTRQHSNHHSNRQHSSRSRSKKSVGVADVGSTGSLPSNDFYYNDDDAAEVINIAQVTPRHSVQLEGNVKVRSAANYEREDNEIELNDRNDQHRFAQKLEVWKKDSIATVTKSSALRWRKLRTPKVREPFALESTPWPKKNKFTPDSDHGKQPAGLDGRTVLINANHSTGEAVNEGWQKYGHNEHVNSMISLRRSLPDVRDSACRELSYAEKLPNASVIITFYNEAWRTLLRTVHSIIDKSPPRLLREVLLIDDGSTEVELKQQLDDYVALLPIIRLIHLQERVGVVRARQHGASLAAADVLIFFDSHCECTPGWLEPLLSRVAENRTVIALPVMDIIDDSTFQYKSFDVSSVNIGGFDWSLHFTWIGISEREKRRRASDIAPIRSPTMSGGLYVISRSWFNDLGGYDVGMDVWGAENLEMSFRIWMCGGSIEVVPCSHVGHVFRLHRTHKFATGSDTHKNYLRVAEVWLDEYKDHVYEKLGYLHNKEAAKYIYGDVTDRRELRSRLECRSFSWYLKTVYPELFIPSDALATGEIRNSHQHFRGQQGVLACIDSIVGSNAFKRPVGVWPCHGQGGNQYWMLSAIGEIRRDDSCMDFSGVSGDNVVIYPCHGQHGNQAWQYREDGSLRHRSTGLCMQLSRGSTLVMAGCNGSSQQLWIWKRSGKVANVVRKQILQGILASSTVTVRPPPKIAQEIAVGDY